LPAYVKPIEVRFRDVDALDHVNHAVILTYAETARCDWFAEVAGVASMAQLPIILASAHVEYKAPIAKTDAIEVAMSLTRIGSKSFTFRYDVRHRRTKQVFAEVETVQVCYDYAKQQTLPIPDALLPLLERLQDARADPDARPRPPVGRRRPGAAARPSDSRI
jgi:acyl-CoA thioester hydrolase